MPPEYGSTSEEEFGSNRNLSKHGRPHLRPSHILRSPRLPGATPSPVSGSAPGPGGVVLKHRMREQDEYIRDWTAHSEEIARYLSTLRYTHIYTYALKYRQR